jgi:hypothetical protein
MGERGRVPGGYHLTTPASMNGTGMRPPSDPPPGLIALRDVAYRERECARRGCLVRCLRIDKMRTALRDTRITSPPRGSRLLRGYRGSLTCLIFAGSPKKRCEQEAQRNAKGDSKADERQTFHRHALWSRAARSFGGDDQTLKNGGLVSSDIPLSRAVGPAWGIR